MSALAENIQDEAEAHESSNDQEQNYKNKSSSRNEER